MKRSNSNSSLFLIELVIVILLFSICSAVSMRMFVTSRQLVQRSNALSSGVLTAQSAAECYKAYKGELNKVSERLDGKTEGGSKVLVGYDAQWEQLAARRLSCCSPYSA